MMGEPITMQMTPIVSETLTRVVPGLDVALKAVHSERVDADSYCFKLAVNAEIYTWILEPTACCIHKKCVLKLMIQCCELYRTILCDDTVNEKIMVSKRDQFNPRSK
jgi:hypothetical protein